MQHQDHSRKPDQLRRFLDIDISNNEDLCCDEYKKSIKHVVETSFRKHSSKKIDANQIKRWIEYAKKIENDDLTFNINKYDLLTDIGGYFFSDATKEIRINKCKLMNDGISQWYVTPLGIALFYQPSLVPQLLENGALPCTSKHPGSFYFSSTDNPLNYDPAVERFLPLWLFSLETISDKIVNVLKDYKDELIPHSLVTLENYFNVLDPQTPVGKILWATRNWNPCSFHSGKIGEIVQYILDCLPITKEEIIQKLLDRGIAIDPKTGHYSKANIESMNIEDLKKLDARDIYNKISMLPLEKRIALFDQCINYPKTALGKRFSNKEQNTKIILKKIWTDFNDYHSQNLFDDAQLCQLQKKYDEAIAKFSDLITRNSFLLSTPSNLLSSYVVPSYYHRGEIHKEMKKIDLAIKDFNSYIQLSTDRNRQVYLLLGDCYSEQNNFVMAIPNYQFYAESYSASDKDEVYAKLVWAYFHIGDFNQALKIFNTMFLHLNLKQSHPQAFTYFNNKQDHSQKLMAYQNNIKTLLDDDELLSEILLCALTNKNFKVDAHALFEMIKLLDIEDQKQYLKKCLTPNEKLFDICNLQQRMTSCVYDKRIFNEIIQYMREYNMSEWIMLDFSDPDFSQDLYVKKLTNYNIHSAWENNRYTGGQSNFFRMDPEATKPIQKSNPKKSNPQIAIP